MKCSITYFILINFIVTIRKSRLNKDKLNSHFFYYDSSTQLFILHFFIILINKYWYLIFFNSKTKTGQIVYVVYILK